MSIKAPVRSDAADKVRMHEYPTWDVWLKEMDMEIAIDRKLPDSMSQEEIHSLSKGKKFDELFDLEVQVVFVQTYSDPDVGIFAAQISPDFEDIDELYKWLVENAGKIDEYFANEDWDSMDKLRGV